MSGYIAKDAKVGAGTWLVAGLTVAGISLLLFSGARAVSSLIVVRAPGRLVKMSGGSTPQNLAALNAAFGPNVADLGNGLYSVIVATDTTATVPGASVA